MSNHLTDDSNIYTQFRPTVPDIVINEILSYLTQGIDPKDWDIAVDVGCGSGQSTNQLSKHFRHCYGLDVSQEQINEAKESKHSNNVCFNVCSAEDMPQIGTNSVQLLTAISSAHCFGLEEFFSECHRILEYNGVIALSDSNSITITDPLKPNDNHLNDIFYNYYFDKRLKPFMNPNITITINDYKDIEFPENYEYVYKNNINVCNTITAYELVGWYQTLPHFQALNSAEKQSSEELIIEFSDKLREVLKTDELSTKEVSISYTSFTAMARKVLYQTFKGYKFPHKVNTEMIEYRLNYNPTHLDRILITYPKCGTFWTLEIMQMVINSGHLERKNWELFMKYCPPVSEQEVRDRINSFSSGRHSDEVISSRSHLCYELLPYNKSAKYLLVLRNPKDVCVSTYNYLRNLNVFTINLHQFLKIWIKGDIPWGDYFAFYKQYWIYCKTEQNFTILLYEKMNRDIKQSIETIAQFLGQKYVNRLSNDDKLMDQIIQKSSINAMKGFHEMGHHLRKGIVGDWRSHLTRDESDLIDKKVEEEWMGTGLELLWKEEMKWIAD